MYNHKTISTQPTVFKIRLESSFQFCNTSTGVVALVLHKTFSMWKLVKTKDNILPITFSFKCSPFPYSKTV